MQRIGKGILLTALMLATSVDSTGQVVQQPPVDSTRPVAAAAPAGVLTPELLLRSDPARPEYALPAPRDFTVDVHGNLYICDYDDYRIVKYGPDGSHLATIAAADEAEPLFKHLMTIQAIGDGLLALDSVALLTFDARGAPAGSERFAAEQVCDLPRVAPTGDFVGQQILAPEVRMILGLRDRRGVLREELAAFDLREFFPELQEGEDFFLSTPELRGYCYDWLPDGRIVWAATDQEQIRIHAGGASRVLARGAGRAVPLPEEAIASHRARSERAAPPFHAYIPSHYQIIRALCAGPRGEIWAVIKTDRRAGLVRYDLQGAELGWYALAGDCDADRAILKQYGDRLYFMVTERKAFAVYSVKAPS